MSQRSVLILAAVLTAFSLVVAGAAAGGLWAPASDPAPTAAPAEVAEATPASIPAAVVAQREEAWRKLFDEANSRLAASQEALARLRPVGAKNEPAIPQASAILIARAYSPGAGLVRAPELVSYQGAEAWEVVLDTGTVYVDAVTAMPLHDGTVKPRPAVRKDHDEGHERSSRGSRQAWAHRDHDDDDEDDDD